MSRILAVNWYRLTSIFVASVVTGGSALAAPNSLSRQTQSRFAPWEQYLSAQRPRLGEYLRYDSEVIKRMNPFYDGKAFLINNYNQSAYRWSTQTLTTFDTSTIVTTNVNFFSNISTTSQELFTTAFSSQVMSADNWINARASYLENTFGFTSADAITTAISERSICESSGSSCGLEGFITDYQLVNFGPETTTATSNNTASTTSPSSTSVSTTTSGNSTVTVTTTSQTNVVTSTNSTTTTVTQGTQDIVTQATDATGGSSGTVTSGTTTDTRTFVDQTIEENGTTTTTNTERRDTETSTTSSQRVKKDAHWKLSIAPLIFFDLQSERRLVSLNSHYPSVSMTQLSEKGTELANINTVGLKGKDGQLITSGNSSDTFPGLGAAPLLKIGAQPGGYRVIQRRSGLLGAGAAATLNLVNGQGLMAGVAPFAGLVPMIGKTVVTEQTADSEAHAEILPKLSDPRNADNLNSWQTLDKMTFSSNGGVLFMGGVGLFGFHVGANYIALGTWTTEVQKIDTQKVYVKLTKSDLESFGYVAGAAFVSISKSQFNNADDSFSYMFDLSKADAKNAYNELMKGQLVPAQRLAANKLVTSVIPVESTRSVTAGRIWSIGIGLPFINWSSGSGDLRTASTRQFHPDSSTTEVDYGVYLSTSDWRFFNVNRNRTYGFYAASYKNTDKQGKTDTGIFAQIGYSYRKNSSSDQYDLRTGIRQLVRRTGLKKELLVQVPDTDEPLRHFDVEFLLTISQSASELLMGISREDEAVLQNISEQFMRSYFRPEILAQEGNYNDVCADHAWDATRCVDEMQRETRSAIRDMKAALQTMRQTYKKDSKAFVDSYARFGEAMLTNQFTFQTVFNLLKGRGIWARYRITGTRIASYDLSFDWRPVPAR